jgi:hypothetical protein
LSWELVSAVLVVAVLPAPDFSAAKLLLLFQLCNISGQKTEGIVDGFRTISEGMFVFPELTGKKAGDARAVNGKRIAHSHECAVLFVLWFCLVLECHRGATYFPRVCSATVAAQAFITATASTAACTGA